MSVKEEMNFYRRYMNGLDIKIWNYYIEELEMALEVMYFIINVITKDQQYVYVKMKKGIYLVPMLPLDGHHLVVVIIQLMEAFYSL